MPENSGARLLPNRRCLLNLGVFGRTGLPALEADAVPSRRRARAKSVIFLHQFGGPSHVDTFDMKPNAPAEVRGEYRPLRTSAPGIYICDRLPRLPWVMDKVTHIRSIRHEMKNHNSAGYYSLTGLAPPTDDQRLRDSRELFRPRPLAAMLHCPAGRRRRQTRLCLRRIGSFRRLSSSKSGPSGRHLGDALSSPGHRSTYGGARFAEPAAGDQWRDGDR